MRRLALFRHVFLVSRSIRQTLTPAGLLLAATTGFAGALGLDTQSNLAHTVFALGLALLAVDAAAAWLTARRLPVLNVRRTLPEFATVGHPLRYQIEVGNPGAHPLPSLVLADELAQPWPVMLADDGDTRRNPFDQRVGYPAYLQLLRRLRGVEVDPYLACDPLLPGQRCRLAPALRPLARGIAVFSQLSVVLAGPLGLVNRRRRIDAAPAPDSLPVLPQPFPVSLPPPTGRRLLQPGGISLALRVGDSEEFRALRDYRPGDPLRDIHWRSYARTGKPVVREHQEEYFARHALLLDTAAPPYSPALETAVSLAAGLVVQPHEPDSLLDLLFVGEGVHRLTAGRGVGSTDALLRVLAGVQASPPDRIEPLLASLERHAAQVSSVIAILQAWDAPRQAAIRRLQSLGIRPHVLLVGESPTGDDARDDEFAGMLQRIDIAGTSGSPA